MKHHPKISVVIPCYRVKRFIANVISRIGPEVAHIIVVDDACPESSGKHVQSTVSDPRVTVVFHKINQGVGGAVITGFKTALSLNSDIVVKVDGDGQIDPALIPGLVFPITQGLADYTKGNRFYSHESLTDMPIFRLIGNSGLSFVNKAVSGYWNVMDPTNGFFAIHVAALSLLPLDKISRDYFFESDMLFRLNTIRAVVWDSPMKAVYGEEQSSLRIARVLRDFPRLYLARLIKRIWYNYFLRDFNACSFQLLFGLAGIFFGISLGLAYWYVGFVTGALTPGGTLMLTALPIVMGFQLLLAALAYDVGNVPDRPLLRQVLLSREIPAAKDCPSVVNG